MQFAMMCAIQWNPNVLVKGKELPTQNPPLALRGILTFEDRRLFIFFQNQSTPHTIVVFVYFCNCVSVFVAASGALLSVLGVKE